MNNGLGGQNRADRVALEANGLAALLAIPPSLRKWGMRVTVYGGSVVSDVNGIWTLLYNNYDTNKAENKNWVKLNFNIGVWNMTTTPTKLVSLDQTIKSTQLWTIDWERIIKVTAIVQNDALDSLYMLNGADGGAIVTSAGIDLNRLTGGVFDNTNYGSIAINRGVVHIDVA